MVGTPKVRLDDSVYVGNGLQARAIRLVFTDALAHLAERYARFEGVMARAEMPVAVVWGDHDPFFGVEQGHRTAGAFPDADLRVLPGAGHALPEERPDEIAASVAELAARVTAP